MKRIMLILATVFMLPTLQTTASAQGWLEQLGSAIVKADKDRQAQPVQQSALSPQKKEKTVSQSKRVDHQGGAAVLNTDPKALNISLNSGGAIVTDVTVALPSDGKEYVCCVLMSNYQWRASTLNDLQMLSDQLCYGEQMLTGNGRQQTLTINVPFEYDKMPADGDRLYVQAYLVDMAKASVAGIGKMVLVDENKIRNSLPTSEEFEDAVVGDMIGNLFDNLFGGGGNDSSDDSDGQVCPDCGGSGVCKVCGGDKKDVNGKSCFHCTGNGKCYRCGGKGKIVGFMGF